MVSSTSQPNPTSAETKAQTSSKAGRLVLAMPPCCWSACLTPPCCTSPRVMPPCAGRGSVSSTKCKGATREVHCFGSAEARATDARETPAATSLRATSFADWRETSPLVVTRSCICGREMRSWRAQASRAPNRRSGSPSPAKQTPVWSHATAVSTACSSSCSLSSRSSGVYPDAVGILKFGPRDSTSVRALHRLVRAIYRVLRSVYVMPIAAIEIL
mmetsp:Transcript_1333/g.2864  ORF Transcript_1333/g.2864 Transcript_1333/m.2864 type:complete len:216 (+) Transcript_1333:358-1005(+)